MNINEVIKYPILSEKSYKQMENNVYSFAVHPKTNRAEVKKAIEFIFEVKVEKVNIINIAKQPTKLGRSEGFTNAIKKAIIKLSEGKINIFPDEGEAVEDSYKEESKKQDKPKKTEMSEAEKKAAAKIAAKAKLDANKVEVKKTEVAQEEKKTEPQSEAEINNKVLNKQPTKKEEEETK